jgi:RIO kinase 2
MKVNVEHFRYLTEDDFAVLRMMENATRKQQVIPLTMIESKFTACKNGGLSIGQVSKIVHSLSHIKLIHRVEHAKCQGYRLGYGAYDYLALHELCEKGIVEAVGNQLGVGKESDIFSVLTADGEAVLKIHRLGRTSFKKGVQEHRAYYHFDQTKELNQSSWLLKSKLAAQREFKFLQMLHEAKTGVMVPTPLGYSRHCVVMSLISGDPLYQIRELSQPEAVMKDIIDQMSNIVKLGYVHGDLNEFNILISDDETLGIEKPYIIDFPQMIQLTHPKALGMFMHDLECLERFFSKRFSVFIEQTHRESCIQLFNEMYNKYSIKDNGHGDEDNDADVSSEEEENEE